MTSAFVSIAAGATTVPLNLAYRKEELEFYLSDLEARLLVVEPTGESPARAAAEKLGMPVAELAAAVEALVGSVAEMGRLVGVPTPTIDAILAMTRLRTRTAG